MKEILWGGTGQNLGMCLLEFSKDLTGFLSGGQGQNFEFLFGGQGQNLINSLLEFINT